MKMHLKYKSIEFISFTFYDYYYGISNIYVEFTESF